jgi:hypothetical protein
MVDRCCNLCAHNPYTGAKEGWWTKAKQWIARRLFGKKPPVQDGPPGCMVNSRLFCFDVQDSNACQRSRATARPEFLACKACWDFKPKHEVSGDG